jgi:2-iminobutanoate/2-iminopropanoate deaminase
MASSTPAEVRKGNNVVTDNAPKYIPFFSQAIKTKDTIYAAGNIGFDPKTNKMVDGGIKEQTVRR